MTRSSRWPLRSAIAQLVLVIVAASPATFAASGPGFIGMEVQPMTAEIAAALGLPNEKGVLVRDLAIDGAAAKAGIRHGDILIRFAGVEIDTRETLLKAAAATKPNQKFSATVLRRGKPLEVGLLPQDWPPGRRVERDATAIVPEEGLTFVALTPKIRERFQLRWGTIGVLITLVDPTKAKNSGLTRGEVIVQINQDDVWQPQQIVDKFREAKAKGRKILLLLVEGANGFRYVAYKIN